MIDSTRTRVHYVVVVIAEQLASFAATRSQHVLALKLPASKFGKIQKGYAFMTTLQCSRPGVRSIWRDRPDCTPDRSSGAQCCRRSSTCREQGRGFAVVASEVRSLAGRSAPAARGPVPAHSARLRILERIHLDPKDPDLLVDEVRLEDPEALVEPYEQQITFKRNRDQELLEFVRAENDRNPVDAQGNTTFKHECGRGTVTLR